MIDYFLVYSFLKKITTPFEKWDAFSAGVIDEKGNILKRRRDRLRKNEQDSFSLFDLMILNMKKILAKIPGGDTKLATYAAALYLIRESTVFEEHKMLSEEKEIEDVLKKFEEEMNVTANIAGLSTESLPGLTKKQQKHHTETNRRKAMSIERMMHEMMNKNPLAVKEAISEELSKRILVKIEESKENLQELSPALLKRYTKAADKDVKNSIEVRDAEKGSSKTFKRYVNSADTKMKINTGNIDQKVKSRNNVDDAAKEHLSRKTPVSELAAKYKTTPNRIYNAMKSMKESLNEAANDVLQSLSVFKLRSIIAHAVEDHDVDKKWGVFNELNKDELIDHIYKIKDEYDLEIDPEDGELIQGE